VKPTINRVVIRKGLERQLVLYWYQSHGHLIASEYWSKFYMVSDAVRLNRTDGAIVRIIAPISEPAAERTAEASAFDFAKSLVPTLDRYLPL
jgi:EpsI family protein